MYQDFKQQSGQQNLSFSGAWAMSAPKRQTPELAPTLQRKVAAKSEIKLTGEEHKEVKRLYRDAKTKKPGWLRRCFHLTQRRRKELNRMLFEAGLDKTWCGSLCLSDAEWSGQLHSVWHKVNRV